MISNFFSANSSSFLTKEIIFCGLAALGGLIVLRGLWLELKSDKESEKEWYSDLNDFKKGKHKSWCGEIHVIVGIAVEIIVAVLFAAMDVKEKHDIIKYEAQSDPRSQPITYLAALVTLNVRGTNFNDFFDYRIVGSGLLSI
jgi:hypothetical protein